MKLEEGVFGIRKGTDPQELPAEYLEGTCEKFLAIQEEASSLLETATKHLGKNHNKAASAFGRLRQLFPMAGTYYFWHGYCLLQLGDTGAAVADFRQALRTELPDDLRALAQSYIRT